MYAKELKWGLNTLIAFHTGLTSFLPSTSQPPVSRVAVCLAELVIHGGCLVYHGTLTWFWQAHQFRLLRLVGSRGPSRMKSRIPTGEIKWKSEITSKTQKSFRNQKSHRKSEIMHKIRNQSRNLRILWNQNTYFCIHATHPSYYFNNERPKKKSFKNFMLNNPRTYHAHALYVCIVSCCVNIHLNQEPNSFGFLVSSLLLIYVSYLSS